VNLNLRQGAGLFGFLLLGRCERFLFGVKRAVRGCAEEVLGEDGLFDVVMGTAGLGPFALPVD
jgi:hypothetical protein